MAEDIMQDLFTIAQDGEYLVLIIDGERICSVQFDEGNRSPEMRYLTEKAVQWFAR